MLIFFRSSNVVITPSISTYQIFSKTYAVIETFRESYCSSVPYVVEAYTKMFLRSEKCKHSARAIAPVLPIIFTSNLRLVHLVSTQQVQ